MLATLNPPSGVTDPVTGGTGAGGTGSDPGQSTAPQTSGSQGTGTGTTGAGQQGPIVVDGDGMQEPADDDTLGS